MNRILKLLLLFCLSISPIYLHAQGMAVARWALQGIGTNDSDMTYVAGDAHAIIIVKDNDIYFSMMDNTLENELGPAIKISNIYLSTKPDNKYIIMNGVATLLGSNGNNKSGNMTLKLSKTDGGNDIIFFNFYSDKLYLSGNLVDEEYARRLSALAALGSVVEMGPQLKGTFESALRRQLSK